MKIQSRLVIAGAVRDDAPWLPAIFKNIAAISDLFLSTACIFVESDSSDNSLELLNEFKNSRPDVEVICLGKLQPTVFELAQRVAIARNTYLDLIESKYSDYDLLLILDMDYINSDPVNIEGLLSNFKYTDWDMICANQKGFYGDLWALRHPELMPHDCWEKTHNSFPLTFNAAKRLFVDRRIYFKETDPIIQVQSAFGGSGFVKISSIKGARHEGLANGKHVCEWVSFCRKLNEGKAKIYINPAFINYTTRNRPVKVL